ncbi:MAG: hypothetical protein RIM23_10040 [Coleofasciculus sp. G3-WIS-01]|uniref:hypothetical protein n=1 Tax=Coleofasciculus sp. G3-WIS-01 TaxID=3069528 RepID=UPI0032F8BB05
MMPEEKFTMMPEEKEKYLPWLPASSLPSFTSLLSQSKAYWEWGSGASTIFAAQHSTNIWSVEHDRKWFTITTDLLTSLIFLPSTNKVSLLYRPLSAGYPNAINEVNGTFDVILIDGRQRNECIRNAMQKISQNGTIILDNSNREKYQFGIDLLKKEGFGETCFESNQKPWKCSFFQR